MIINRITHMAILFTTGTSTIYIIFIYHRKSEYLYFRWFFDALQRLVNFTIPVFIIYNYTIYMIFVIISLRLSNNILI